jgi:hypothetical protein
MTAELTEERIEQIRLVADSGFTVDDDDWNALCDAALAHVRGREPVAWRQMIHTWSYFDGPLDPREVHDSGKPCEPLFNTPQPSYRDGLLAAADAVSEMIAEGVDPAYFCNNLRALAEKEG